MVRKYGCNGSWVVRAALSCFLLAMPSAVLAEAAEPDPSGLPSLYRQGGAGGGAWDVLRRERDRLLQPAALLEFLDQIEHDGMQGATWALGTQAYEVLQALLSTGLDSLEREAPRVKNLDFSFHPGVRRGEAGEMLAADLLLSLAERGRGTLFSQGGMQLRDGGRPAFNLGLGYRWVWADQWLVGGNVFYDRLADGGMDRYSLGLELKSRWLDLHGNLYQGLHTGGARRQAARNPDGWDVELAGRVPQLPWIEVLGRYYFWEAHSGEGDDLSGLEYGLRLRPVSFAGLELRYDTPQDGAGAFGLEANLEYRFGVPLVDQLRSRDRIGTPLLLRRFEKVRRQYELRAPAGVETAGAPPSAVRGRVYVDDIMLAGQPLGSPIERPVAGAVRMVTVRLEGLAAAAAGEGLLLEPAGNAILGVDYRAAVPEPAPGETGVRFSSIPARVMPGRGEPVVMRFELLPGNGVRRQLRLRARGLELLLFELVPAPAS